MTVPQTVSSPPLFVTALEQRLQEMDRRLDELARNAAVTPAVFSELTAVYTNVAHVFAYLEGNQRHFECPGAAGWHDRFFAAHARLLSTANALANQRLPDPAEDDLRARWVQWFRLLASGSEQATDDEVRILQDSAKSVLGQIRDDQADLVRRLGLRGSGSPPALFHRAVGSSPDASLRSKLSRAWFKQRDDRLDALTAAVDGMVAIRRRQAVQAGDATVLRRTLRRCDVGEPVVLRFLDSYLTAAYDSHAALMADVSAATGCTEQPIEHLGFYLRHVVAQRPVPLLRLDRCVDYVCAITERVFGLSVRQKTSPTIVTVLRHGQEIGSITFDLLPSTEAGSGREGPRVVSGRPSGHVLCRLHGDGPGPARISFEAVVSVFHEFGHAINHLMMRTRLPGASGLDYLPLERVEDLSTWYEKWAYHDGFGDFLGLDHDEAAGLALGQRLKKLEFLSTCLDRAVVAAIDFDVHARDAGGIRESFVRLDERFDIARFCRFGAIPEHFTYHMFRANPGANFAYLWGSAWAAEAFAPFQGVTFDRIGVGVTTESLFRPCLDPDASGRVPEVDQMFGFYQSARSAGRKGNDT